MSKSRLPLVLGLGAAGGVGYYFYNAGGNARVAENKFESALPSSPTLRPPLTMLTDRPAGDVHRASSAVKAHIPGRTPDAEGAGKSYGAEAGAKLDQAVRIRTPLVPLGALAIVMSCGVTSPRTPCT